MANEHADVGCSSTYGEMIFLLVMFALKCMLVITLPIRKVCSLTRLYLRGPDHVGLLPVQAFDVACPVGALKIAPGRSALRDRRSRRRRSGLRVHFKIPKGNRQHDDDGRGLKRSELLATGRFQPADPNVHPGLQLNIDSHKARRRIDHSCAYATRDAWELAMALGYRLPGLHWPVVRAEGEAYYYLPYRDVLEDPVGAFNSGHLHVDCDGPPLIQPTGEKPPAPGAGVEFVHYQSSDEEEEMSENEDTGAGGRVKDPEKEVSAESGPKGIVSEGSWPAALATVKDSSGKDSPWLNSDDVPTTRRTWLMDTGCPFDLVSTRSVSDVSKYMRRTTQTTGLRTANGKMEVKSEIPLRLSQLESEVVNALVLKDTPRSP